MIDSAFIAKLKSDYSKREQERRQIISRSNEVLFQAKKTIFALQREELVSAEEKLASMETILKKMEKDFSPTRLREEGAYHAAAEEYVEAKTLAAVIAGKKIIAIKGLHLGYDSYLGGFCDLIGEMVRFATNRAAKGKYESVAEMKDKGEEIMNSLLDFDLTGYLRTKYDQARGHLRKLEQMAYEIRLRTDK
jgi:predicted translin family RNA/ssDNA-binding protein